ncbi:MAG: hypothetical protein PPP56_02255 [Longimonas sp.]|uniref:hypothetical protein n=1 Tax=Longimonas sp. TaxID=2039626 RepID=UPI00334B9DF8
MDIADLPTRAPASVPAESLSITDPPRCTFTGWTPEVFEMLARLRETPHIDQYNKEKPDLHELLKDPFKRYRDDLVVNWVLPSRLDFETERYVFSRLLKNDFGAGGCHDNLWMAFYRPHTKRLKDVQISHRIDPDGFQVGIFVGAHATDLLRQAKQRIQQAPEVYLQHVNACLRRDRWRFYYRTGRSEPTTHTDPLDALPDAVHNADGIWLRRFMPRDQVLDWGSDLVAEALSAVRRVWPIYRFYLSDATVKS